MKKIEGKLKKRFKNTFKFSNNNINKCILLLRKGADHMSTWMIGKNLKKQNYLKIKNLMEF